MTNGLHSSWFCLLNSLVMEAWIRVQNCGGNIEREEERENRRVVIHFSLSIQAQNHIKEFRRARERKGLRAIERMTAGSGYSMFCLTSESYATLVDVCMCLSTMCLPCLLSVPCKIITLNSLEFTADATEIFV